jgi:iron complex outermembrane recepter protein
MLRLIFDAGSDMPRGTRTTPAAARESRHLRENAMRSWNTLIVSTVLGVSSLSAAAPLAAQEAARPGGAESDQLQEVVVTAEKRNENILEVPISVSVIDGGALESQHVTNFDAVTRMTPGVSFSAGAGEGAGEGQETIEIRGVSSNVGAATVGVYLDEAPITLPGEVGSSQPKFFDMDRIEVLRGPQGTLYGSSSEGGTLRYIEKPADPSAFSADVAADGSYTQHGSGNDDFRAVLNQPVINDVLAVRIGVQYADQSGWIDRYAHPPGYTNLSISTGQLLGSGVNQEHDIALKLAVTYKPTEALTITPLAYYQRTKADDQPAFFLGQALYTQENNVPQPVRDEFFIGSLKIEQDFGFAKLTSNSSYYWKDINRQADGTYYDPAYVVPYILDPALPQFQPKADPALSSLPTTAYDNQTVTNLVQEFRLASRPPTGDELPLRWVGGLYLSYQSYRLLHKEVAPGWNQIFQSVYGFSPDSPLSPVSDPAFPDLWAGDQFQHNREERKELEYAAFGQLDYDFTARFHGAVGARYDWASLPYDRFAGGFFNVGLPTFFSAVTHDDALTPKVSLKFDISSTSNVYASAAEGFRVGGINNPVPYSICQQDYINLGISAEPAAYAHDSLWTYELGSKAALFEQTLSFTGAIYDTQWKNIQQEIELPLCGYAYVSNVGDAQIRGAEFELHYKIPALRGFTVGLNGDVQNARITAAPPGSPAAVGQHVLYTPEWDAAATADYTWPVSDDLKAFVHADVELTGPSNGGFQVGTPNYDDSAYAVVNANFGVDIHGCEVSLYSTNLLDDTTIIKHPQVNLVIEAYSVQPRTVGLRVAKHFL